VRSLVSIKEVLPSVVARGQGGRSLRFTGPSPTSSLMPKPEKKQKAQGIRTTRRSAPYSTPNASGACFFEVLADITFVCNNMQLNNATSETWSFNTVLQSWPSPFASLCMAEREGQYNDFNCSGALHNARLRCMLA